MPSVLWRKRLTSAFSNSRTRHRDRRTWDEYWHRRLLLCLKWWPRPLLMSWWESSKSDFHQSYTQPS